MKKTFIVSYDLPEGSDYAPLHNALKSYGPWAKITKSTWAIVTTKKAKEIRDHLLKSMPDGGRILVAKTAGIGAWRNVICSNDWLKKYL